MHFPPSWKINQNLYNGPLCKKLSLTNLYTKATLCQASLQHAPSINVGNCPARNEVWDDCGRRAPQHRKDDNGSSKEFSFFSPFSGHFVAMFYPMNCFPFDFPIFPFPALQPFSIPYRPDMIPTSFLGFFKPGSLWRRPPSKTLPKEPSFWLRNLT